jgi:hypothetical protein
MAWGRNCTFGSLGGRLSKFSRESCLQCIRILSSVYIHKVCTFFVHQIYKGQWLCLDRKLGLWKVDGQKNSSTRKKLDDPVGWTLYTSPYTSRLRHLRTHYDLWSAGL